MFYNKEQILQMIHEANKTSVFTEFNSSLINKWEYDILLKIGAITTRAIKCDYPILKVKNKDKDYEFDCDGDIYQLLDKEREIKKTTKLAETRIEYIPKSYCNCIAAKKQWREELDGKVFAEKVNTPPVEVYDLDNLRF